MLAQQRKLTAALRRTKVFLTTNEDRLGTVIAGVMRLLDNVIQAIEALSDEQDPTRFQRATELEGERGARYRIRERNMRPIACVAKLELPTLNDFDRLRLPPKKKDSSTYIVHARAMAAVAELYLATFVDNGLAPDFITRLLSAADALQEAVDERSRAHSSRVGATAALRTESTRAMRIIALIDSLVAPELADDDQLATAWVLTRTVARRRAAAVVEATDTASAETATEASIATEPVAPRLTIVTSREETAA